MRSLWQAPVPSGGNAPCSTTLVPPIIEQERCIPQICKHGGGGKPERRGSARRVGHPGRVTVLGGIRVGEISPCSVSHQRSSAEPGHGNVEQNDRGIIHQGGLERCSAVVMSDRF
jgi:hypothetical protein